MRLSNAGFASARASFGNSTFELVPDAAAIDALEVAETKESPVKPKKVGYLRAKFNNFLS